jgi:hypothetical protein
MGTNVTPKFTGGETKPLIRMIIRHHLTFSNVLQSLSLTPADWH